MDHGSRGGEGGGGHGGGGSAVCIECEKGQREGEVRLETAQERGGRILSFLEDHKCNKNTIQ